MVTLTCFIGVIGAGKDYQAKKLVTEQGYKQINVADTLRDMTWEILNWTPDTTEEYESFKSNGITYFLTGREFLQNLGTALKTRHKSYWAKLWSATVVKELNKGNNICCSDIRYIDELDEALKLNGSYIPALDDFVNVQFIFCDYRSDRYNNTDTHISERLAQLCLSLGFVDGRLLSSDDLYILRQKYVI